MNERVRQSCDHALRVQQRAHDPCLTTGAKLPLQLTLSAAVCRLPHVYVPPHIPRHATKGGMRTHQPHKTKTMRQRTPSLVKALSATIKALHPACSNE